VVEQSLDTLGGRLRACTKTQREIGSPFPAALDRLAQRLRECGAAGNAPGVGEVFSDFLLPDHSGRMVARPNLLSSGPLIVIFNRGHWRPYCKIELDEYSKFHREIADLGAQLVSIMPERQQSTRDFVKTFQPPSAILTDLDNGYALSLGLAVWIGRELRDLLIECGDRLDAPQGNDHWFAPIPATFVVARDGRVIARFVDAEFRNRMEPHDAISALRGDLARVRRAAGSSRARAKDSSWRSSPRSVHAQKRRKA